MTVLNHNEFVAVSSKYAIYVCNMSECLIKQSISSACCDTDILTCICFSVCFYVFMFMMCDILGSCCIVIVMFVCFYCGCLTARNKP